MEPVLHNILLKTNYCGGKAKKHTQKKEIKHRGRGEKAERDGWQREGMEEQR